MINFSAILLALAAGIGLGFFYFGGLWLTVRQIPQTRRPMLLTLGSFLARMGVSLFGFYIIVRGGHWERLMGCLVGFLLVRTILVRRWRPQQMNQQSSGKKG